MDVRDALPSIVAALAIVFTSSALAGERWDALWRTADQRGEQLLHDGKAADAAHTYRDPRRKAYAEMVAGDYRAAAQGRSEARRVGEEWGRTCRSRWST